MTPLTEGFLTKEDFEFLYDKSSEVLHERNPFSANDPIIDIRCSASQWAARIQRLVSFHNVDLVDGSKWLVQISGDGPVKLWPASPTDSISPAPATREWECSPPEDVLME
jgi:hypothetical protein